MPASYCVQLVDDHDLMRLGLMALAHETSALKLIWLQASNLSDALAQHRSGARIDLVLLDLNLPDSQGLQGLQSLLQAVPRLPIAVFSATEDEFVVRQALALGAKAFLPKSGSAKASLQAVESLLRGDVPGLVPWRGPAAADAYRTDLMRQRAGALNATQIKVLELLLAGMGNNEIAQTCNLAVGTVKNAVSSIFLTLDVRSRAHLISLFR